VWSGQLLQPNWFSGVHTLFVVVIEIQEQEVQYPALEIPSGLLWGCRSERLKIILTVGSLSPFLSVAQLPQKFLRDDQPVIRRQVQKASQAQYQSLR